jgi:hypothetical protein
MAFLIPDNLKSRPDVPAGIRRTADAFLVGLDETVTVWYEPLYDTTGSKPHLVLLFPDRGIVVLEALEVKAGGILGALRGKIRVQRDGKEIELGNPLNRAERLAESLRDRIAAEPRLGSVPIAAGAVFPSLTSEEATEKSLQSVVALQRCLFRSELEAAIRGEGGTVLARHFAHLLGGRTVEHLDENTEKLLRGVIQPETVIERVAARNRHQLTLFRPSEEGDIIRVMDRKQEAMAKGLGDGHRVIRGVAGSGKTLILVYRARLMSQMFPQKQILVTCYTRSLAGHLRYLLEAESNVHVIHLDKIMYDVIRQSKLRWPGFDDNDPDRVPRVALEAQAKVGLRYDAVLLDEAQDFSTLALRFVVSLLGNGDELVVVADAAQNIFRRKFSWKDAGIQAQGRTRILRTNYRNTQQILRFASNFLLAGSLRAEDVPDEEDEHALIPPEAAARVGEEPVILLTDSVEEEIRSTVDSVEKTLSKMKEPRSVAVLYGTGQANGRDRPRAILDALRSRGLSAFWANDPSDKKLRDRLASAPEPVVISTIFGSKGLEFPHVVLCGLWREREDKESNRKLAYVGMTRATESLTIVASRDNPLVADLEIASS